MTPPTPRRQTALAVLLALGALLATPAGASAASAPKGYTEESKEAFEQQLDKGEIKSAEFNKKLRSVHITTSNGTLYLYHYQKKGSPAVMAKLRAKHVHYTVLSPSAAAAEQKTLGVKHKHKIRYIVGAVVLVLIVIGAIVFFMRRGRMRD